MYRILCHFGDMQRGLIVGSVRDVLVMSYDGLIRAAECGLE